MKVTYFVLLALLAHSAHALHFYLTEGTEKCLTDDIPAQTHIQGHTHLKDKLPGVEAGSKTDGVKIVVYGPDKAEVFSKLSVYGKDGKDKFAFTAQKGGNYRFCMVTTTYKYVSKNEKLRFGLRLIVGDQEQEEKKDAAKMIHITSLQKKVETVKQRAHEFIEYQQMNSRAEDELAQANIKINDRVILFTIIETFIILSSGVFQILSLKKFFAQKRFTY